MHPVDDFTLQKSRYNAEQLGCDRGARGFAAFFLLLVGGALTGWCAFINWRYIKWTVAALVIHYAAGKSSKSRNNCCDDDCVVHVDAGTKYDGTAHVQVLFQVDVTRRCVLSQRSPSLWASAWAPASLTSATLNQCLTTCPVMLP